MIVYRHCPKNRPFIWEGGEQPAARWHADGEGPAHYFADTADGAWAEFLRHAEVDDMSELEHIQRAIWAVEIDDGEHHRPRLAHTTLTGGQGSYADCQKAARRLRAAGVRKIQVPSAALRPGGAAGWVTSGGLKAGPPRNGWVIVLFDDPVDAVGWLIGTSTVPPYISALYRAL